ncbi:hypothetical protein PPYR_05971 [Photinus pyralis]|uniref:Neuropeptide F n=1 Tax=Photinus pyralis TaxID=7054 RepID=A0A5N4ASC8_PHOPY|nr:uncharacterized protein LOC116166911 isoform X3 [Photinus pyralis]XP_031337977.1 uncharacterized protein LOC116166911 isoform X3 [Photinus pyralis]XP_031337978.1 uncharacterized protein LOC116166911 isoform X3 [Photinus pyralis]KAB0800231.1 hypothetical protein PPYR_05971 [Photinus pyralis]
MRWSAVWWFAFVAAAAILQEAYVRAAPNPQPEDMWKTLLELDRMYSSIARPSVRSGPTTIDSNMTPKVQRAINMLKLHHLERLYADRSRPRFGKRAGAHSSNFGIPDYENQFQNGDPTDYFPVRR